MNPDMFRHFGPVGTNSPLPIEEPGDSKNYSDGGRKVLSLDERRKRKNKNKMQKASRKCNR